MSSSFFKHLSLIFSTLIIFPIFIAVFYTPIFTQFSTSDNLNSASYDFNTSGISTTPTVKINSDGFILPLPRI